MATKRLSKELNDLDKQNMLGKDVSDVQPIAASPVGDNLFQWRAVLAGEAPYYEGGKFMIQIDIPTDYPFKPPKVKFLTKIYHPGIDSEGNICLAELKDTWVPAMTLIKLLPIIRKKMNEPSVDDPFVPEIANELKSNEAQFATKAKEATNKHAKKLDVDM